MAHWFDNLAVQVAEEKSSRRLALGRVGAGLAGALGLLVLGGSRASAWGDSGHDEDDDEEKQREKNTCDQGLKRCGSICAVIAIDPDNCGDCGTTCQTGQVCRRGKCVTECPPASCNIVTCPAGQTACGSTCCMAGQTCMNGVCQIACPPGTTSCNGMCVNLSASGQNCGACGHACNMLQTCVGGVCTCAMGTTLCGNMCAETQTDPNNCGTCGTVCSFPHATAICMAGTCTIGMCNTGFANCNGVVADGCETNTMTDAANCGACGNSCGAGGTCTMGVCSCPTGTIRCGSLCVDLGMCGPCAAVVCFAGTTSCPPLPPGAPCPGNGTCDGIGHCVPGG